MNKNDSRFLSFPRRFLWGVSTSAHQIEGGNANDWTVWESSPERLADLQARGKNVADYQSGRAADSWELYERDFDLIEELHCGAYRFGLEWSRIEPEEGKFCKEAIEHYKKMIRSLKERNIKVVLTLWHWTSPIWLANIGGWTNKKVADYFARYSQVCIKEFGADVDYWVTLNEPLMIIGHGYLDGKFPPNHKGDIWNSWLILKNYIRSHKLAYMAIHAEYPEAQVGLAMTTGYFDALNPHNIVERLMVWVADYFRNYWFLAKVKGFYDYIGVNYYHHDRLTWRPPFKKNDNREITDFGWEIYPEGLYHVLKGYAKLKKPMYITENGIADTTDAKRAEFIKRHLSYLHKAIMEDCDVRGYFHWSLVDNFEWADGYSMKFGLHEVNRQTFERTARPSAKAYAEICKNNGFWVDCC